MGSEPVGLLHFRLLACCLLLVIVGIVGVCLVGEAATALSPLNFGIGLGFKSAALSWHCRFGRSVPAAIVDNTLALAPLPDTICRLRLS